MPVASYSRLILTRDRGNPVIFSLGLGPERSALRELVERHGGLLEDPRHKDESGFRISLADPAQKLHDASKDLFRLDYVRDCVQKGQLIPNLRDYRLGEKSVYLDYDPFKVLKGELTWAQLERSKENLDDVCSDSDDDGVDGSSRYPMASRPPQSRNPYTQREKEQILCYIVKKRAYNLLKGNEFWIRAAARLNLGRTWQSLKEHFRKQIYPALGSLGGVSKRHQTKIKLGYDGDLVESSFEEEEEEESAPAEGPDSRMGTPSVTSTPLVAPASKNASKSPNSLYYDTADENGQAVPEESGRTPPNKKKKTKKLFSQNPTENLVFEPTDEEILVDHRLSKNGPTVTVSPVKASELPGRSPSKRPSKYLVYEPTPRREAVPSPSSKAPSREPPTPTSPGPQTLTEESQNVAASVSPVPKRARPQTTDGASSSSMSTFSPTQEETPRKRTRASTRAEKQANLNAPVRVELPAEQTPVESPHPSPSILASQNEPTDQDRAVFEEQEQNQEEQEEEEEEEEPEFRRPMRTPRKPLKPRRVLKPRQRKQSNPSKFVVRKASGSVEENDTLEEISLPSSKDSTHEVSDDDDVEEELKEPSPSGSKTSGPRRMKRSAALANSDCGEKTPPKEVVEPEENTATEAAGSDSSSSYDLSENEGGNRNQEEDGDYSQTGLFEDSRISTTGLAARRPYTWKEDNCIQKYIVKNGFWEFRNGNEIWKDLAAKKLLPGRSWQSLRNRALKVVFASGIRPTDAEWAENDGHDQKKKEANSKALYQKRKPYSRFEDEKIVRYLIDSRRHSEVNGNTVWKLMETKKVIKGRSWQSIKERFRKKIRVSLADWANFTDAEKALFGLDKN